MRILIAVALMVSSFSLKAQTISPANSFMNFMYPAYWRTSPLMNISDKKWSLNHFAAVNTGFSFFNGGTSSMVSVPVGLQLTRKLNENLYAFAAVSGVPAYLNFNGTLPGAGFNKYNSINSPFRNNALAVYGRAELGLMYVNDAKTFSISGSVGVQRSSYPGMPYYPNSQQKQNHVVQANR